jgi:nucleoside 2-deoxyribosyltransferase
MGDAKQGDKARLLRLARLVIEPLMAEIEKSDGVRYVVTTPYNPEGEHIMNDVIYAIDRADLVIADLTDANPNVFYKLGIVHALGRACITVVEERNDKIPFDNAAYRAYKVNLDEDEDYYYQQARDRLRQAVEIAHRKISDWSDFENPVIDFFRAPITYISPAYALAQGYYHNFVRPVVTALIDADYKGYRHEIGVGELASDPKELKDTTLLERDVRRKLSLHVVVPARIALTKHHFADRFRGHLPTALVEGRGRPYTCFYRVDDATHALIDIPTTVRVMEEAVDKRMRYPNVKRTDKVWREVEAQELDRFCNVLQYFIDRNEANPEFSGRVQIVRYDPDEPADMLWLHNILNNR